MAAVLFRLVRVSGGRFSPSGKRTIYGKVTRETLNVPPRPKPFPYDEKTLFFWRTWYDTTSSRLDANSKILVVEGPPAVGKTALAKRLAEDLDMLHMPEATMDDYYVNDYGYDLRRLDPQLPAVARSYDHTNFCRDPFHPDASSFQLMMYTLRYSRYVDALVHLLNTGQGVVLERSPQSDVAFMNAMRACGYVSAGARSLYADVRINTVHELLRPHLVIYLDAPVDVVRRKIAERGLEHERDSVALTVEYLTALETEFKAKYLKDASVHSELLVYDWSDGGDPDVVVEDIERVDLEGFDKKSSKMSDWRYESEQMLNDVRRKYTNCKYYLMRDFNVGRHDVPETLIDGESHYRRCEVWSTAPGMRYVKGFNAPDGDTDLSFKTRGVHRETLDHF